MTAFKVSGANWGCPAGQTRWAAASCILSPRQNLASPWREGGSGEGQVPVYLLATVWDTNPPLQVGFALAEPSCRPLDLKKCQRIHS